MALDIDGFEVLRAIAALSSAFSDIQAEVNKTARTLVIKQLKSKSTDLPKMRDVYRALGADSFALIVDGLSDAQVKTLLGKHDKHNPEVKTGSAHWRRSHFIALVGGSAEPVVKPEKKQPVKKARVQKTQDAETLNFRSAGVRRKR